MSLALSHAKIAYKVAASYFWPGATREDVKQEALLALIVAERGYRPEQGAFGPFAKTVVVRHLIECVRRERYRRPQFADSLDPVDPVDPVDVVDLVHARFWLREILETPLSELEAAALGRAFRGEGCPRPLDNALQRAKAKLAA